MVTAASSDGMQSSREALVKGIHSTATKAVFYITGGAVSALSWLTSVPGSSRTVLEAVIPYAQKASDQLLGGSFVDSYSGKEQSRALAKAAYQKAADLTAVGEWDFVGVSAACALVTDRAKQGDHHCCVSVCGCERTKTYTLLLDKGARNRLEEETVASQLLLAIVAEAFGVLSENDVRESMRFFLSQAEQEALQAESEECQDPISLLLNGSVRCVEYCDKHYVLNAPRRGVLLLPGSFNPLHEGHVKMMDAAAQATGRQGMFELSVVNPDKGVIDGHTLRTRLEQFDSDKAPVLLTRAPLFRDKAAFFPDCTFVVGYDTAVRIIEPRYYGDNETNMMVELGTIRNHGCRFLVAGRAVETEGSEKYLAHNDIQFPTAIKDLFSGLDDFRMDISSTEIRARLAK